MTLDDLRRQRSVPRKGSKHALDAAAVASHLALLDGWKQSSERSEIQKAFKFADFYETIAFVNAIAWIANAEDHHPDLEVGYSRCLVRFSTHDVGGLSLNDFICAAKVEALIER